MLAVEADCPCLVLCRVFPSADAPAHRFSARAVGLSHAHRCGKRDFVALFRGDSGAPLRWSAGSAFFLTKLGFLASCLPSAKKELSPLQFIMLHVLRD